MNLILANMFGLGGPDIWIVAGVVVLLFGGSKLANFGKSAGEALKEFKKATRDEDADHAAPTTVEESASHATPIVTPISTPSHTASTTTKE